MRVVQFALVREGKSDDGLATLIRALLVRAGVPGVIGAARSYTGTTRERLERVLAEEVIADLIFIHRDSDARDPAERRAEVMDVATEFGCADRVVAVVPVQETEAWLLTDEAAIRTAVGRPGGKAPLGLPSVRHIEATAKPKELLKSACNSASEASGRRLKKVSGQFDRYRATLLERLDIDGPVTELESWRRFVADLNSAAAEILLQREDGAER